MGGCLMFREQPVSDGPRCGAGRCHAMRRQHLGSDLNWSRGGACHSTGCGQNCALARVEVGDHFVETRRPYCPAQNFLEGLISDDVAVVGDSKPPIVERKGENGCSNRDAMGADGSEGCRTSVQKLYAEVVKFLEGLWRRRDVL